MHSRRMLEGYARRLAQMRLQPHGFERFGLVLVDNQSYGLLPAEGPYPGDVVVDVHPAASATASRVDQDDNRAAWRLDDLVRLEAEFIEGLAQLPQRSANRIPPAEGAGGIDDRGRLTQLEVRRQELDVGLTPSQMPREPRQVDSRSPPTSPASISARPTFRQWRSGSCNGSAGRRDGLRDRGAQLVVGVLRGLAVVSRLHACDDQ